MGFLEELADRACERLTSRNGCLGPDGYPQEEQCDPCRARVELGRPTEAPRHCTHCGVQLDVPLGAVHPADVIDVKGELFCPPRPHTPNRFYDEYGKP